MTEFIRPKDFKYGVVRSTGELRASDQGYQFIYFKIKSLYLLKSKRGKPFVRFEKLTAINPNVVIGQSHFLNNHKQKPVDYRVDYFNLFPDVPKNAIWNTDASSYVFYDDLINCTHIQGRSLFTILFPWRYVKIVVYDVFIGNVYDEEETEHEYKTLNVFWIPKSKLLAESNVP